MKRPVLWMIVASAGLTGLTGCSTTNPEATKTGKKEAVVHVSTTDIRKISIQRQVELAGTLISPDQATVSSEVAGVVRRALVELGQEVKPGQVLVELDPRELELALSRAQSLLRQTEAQLGIDGVRTKEPAPEEQISMVRTAAANRDDARAQLARARRLMERRLLSQADLDAAETRVKVTEAAYQAATENVQSLKASLQERRSAVELAQKKLNDAVIRAPVGGSVSERLVHPGEFIRENTPVVKLVQINPLKLKTAVQERYASLIRPQLEVQFQVESYPDTTFTGKVAFVSPAVDQETRTFTVEVLVDNQKRLLKPGFFAKGVIFTHKDENVLAVPEEAISTLAGVSTVSVVENGMIRQQIVSIGERQGNLLEVLSGLNGDETLATSSLSQLANGLKVRTGDAGMDAAPEPEAGNPAGGKKKGGRP